MTFDPDLLTLVAKVYDGGSLTIARSACVLRFIDLHMRLLRKKYSLTFELVPQLLRILLREGAKIRP